MSGDTSGKFNATIDFFQLVVECHILVAAMHFFSMKTLDSTPSKNALPLLDGKNNDEKWSILRQRITKLINRYVLVDQVASGLNRESEQKDVGLQSAQQLNPHISRIASEHCYTLTHHARVAAEHSYTQPQKDVKKKRQLPSWMLKLDDKEATPYQIQKFSPDGVFNYASAVLNDGLLLMELRDAIHEGDGPRILRCWKFMLIYWRHTGHTKYAHEAVQLTCAVQGAASEQIVKELVWCRTVNPRGGAGNNIPADLYLEHLNRILKDCLHIVGPNISIQSIVQASKSLKKLLDIGSHFDKVCKIRPVSMHHTSPSSKEDQDKIISQLATESRVFDYIPGRFHHTFKNIQPHISSHVNVVTLTTWIKQTKQSIVKHHMLKQVLQK